MLLSIEGDKVENRISCLRRKLPPFRAGEEKLSGGKKFDLFTKSFLLLFVFKQKVTIPIAIGTRLGSFC